MNCTYSVQDTRGTHGKFGNRSTARVWLRHIARALQREGRTIDWRSPDRFVLVTKRYDITEVRACRVIQTPSTSTGEGRGKKETAA